MQEEIDFQSGKHRAQPEKTVEKTVTANGLALELPAFAGFTTVRLAPAVAAFAAKWEGQVWPKSAEVGQNLEGYPVVQIR